MLAPVSEKAQRESAGESTMKKMPGCFLILLALCGCTTQQTFVFKRKPFDPSVLNVIIPHIKVEDLTVEEAAKVIEAKWQEQLKDKSPPQIVFFRRDVSHAKNQRQVKISFEAKSIPIEDCLKLLTQLGPMEPGFRIKNGNLLFSYYHSWLDSDQFTRSFDASEKAIAFFNLTEQTTPDELTSLLGSYGIKFGYGDAYWMPIIGKIRITTYAPELEKFSGLLSLIDIGCEIKRTEETDRILEPQIQKDLEIKKQREAPGPFFMHREAFDPFVKPR
jgi:hypothetical protein